MALLFPLAASLLYVAAIMFIKRAADLGAGIWRTTFVTNLTTAVLFGFLWFRGGEIPDWGFLYQPAVVGLLFLAGQMLMFAAVEHGDVSIATPVLGTKIIVVAGLQSVLTTDPVTPELWVSAALATGAVVLLNSAGGGQHKRVGLTIGLSFLSGASFALFDVLVQKWSPAWGAGRFLPILFLMVALYTFIFLHYFKAPLREITPSAWRWLGPGAFLMGAQALCIVCGIALFGRATEFNIVYSSRGLWSVAAVWLIGHWFVNREQALGPAVLQRRLMGALLLMAAIVLVLT